jgi:hypothetical protein
VTTYKERPPRKAPISEKEFMQNVLDLASVTGWMRYHTHDSRRSHAGFPDLVLVRPPRLVVAELKVGKNKTTRSQDAWLAALMGCPQVEVFVWRPTDWPEIARTLARPRVRRAS